MQKSPFQKQALLENCQELTQDVSPFRKVPVDLGMAHRPRLRIREHRYPLLVHMRAVRDVSEPDSHLEDVFGRTPGGLDDAPDVGEHHGTLLLDPRRGFARLRVLAENAARRDEWPDAAGRWDRIPSVMESLHFDTATFVQDSSSDRQPPAVTTMICSAGDKQSG